MAQTTKVCYVVLCHTQLIDVSRTVEITDNVYAARRTFGHSVELLSKNLLDVHNRTKAQIVQTHQLSIRTQSSRNLMKWG